jgi:Zn-dependent protease
MHFGPETITSWTMAAASVTAHESAHAAIARVHGDPTAVERGRLTANPLAHLDPWGAVVVPLALIVTASPILFAWGRQAPMDRAKLRHPRRDTLRVALAGPIANLVLAMLFAAVARALPEAGMARSMAVAGVAWNCALALFNLIPIPPLDGAWVLQHFLRLRHILALHHFRAVALAVVVAMMALPPSRWFFEVSLHGAIGTCFGLFGLSASGSPR